jgi:TonB family protein
MPRSEGQAAETGKQSDYEAAVLDLLNREIAPAQPIQDIKSQFEELDELVANLLQQTIAEADHPHATGQTAPAISGASPPGDKCAGKEPPAATQPDHKDELATSEFGDQVFAEFMRSQDAPTAQNIDAALFESEPEFNFFKDDMYPVSDYMYIQAQRSAKEGEAPLESILDSSQFEDLNDVLAEYETTEKAASGIQIETEAIDNAAPPSKCSDEHCLNAVFIAGNETASTADAAVAPVDTHAMLIQTNNPDALAADLMPAPEKAILSADPELSELQGSAHTETARIFEAAADKSETATSITAPFASTILCARGSKAPLIATASLSVLALIGILVYFHSGNEQKSAEPPSVQAISGSSAAVPIKQISPRYPELAIQKRESSVVVLELDISSEGHVAKATPVSGSRLFHKEAVSTVMKWRYRPASLNGVNMASKSRVTLNFNLGNQ